MINNNSIIPIKTNSNYYIFDSVSCTLYQCSKTSYELLVNNDLYFEVQNKEFDFDKAINYNYSKKNISNAIEQIKAIVSVINNVNKHTKYYQFPEFSTYDIQKRLAYTKNVVFEVTEKCNLKCKYCCYGDLYKQTQKGSTKDKKDILSYIEAILDLKLRNKVDLNGFMISFYGGEPLVRFDIIKDAVSLVKEKIGSSTHIRYSMTTNGVLIKKHIDFLVENSFEMLISLDGNKDNNSYRLFPNGKNSFDIIKKNIESIKHIHSDYFNSKIGFSSVLHNRNDSLSSYLFFEKYGKIPYFSYLSTEGVKMNKRKDFDIINTYYTYSEDEISSIKKRYPELYDRYFNDKVSEAMALKREKINSINDLFHANTTYPGSSCSPFENRAFIDVEGNIYICEKSDRRFIFGKVKSGKIVLYTKKINNYYRDINNTFANTCMICYKRASCKECYFDNYSKVSKHRCLKNYTSLKKEITEIISQEERVIHD